MLTIRTGCASDIGLCREVNEDNLFAGDRLFAVADGMGGHAAGEVASSLAVGRFEVLDRLPVITPEEVRAALAAANQDIVEATEGHADLAGMGTTMTGLGLVQFAGAEHWMVFNIGDSRVYRWSGHGLVRLTVDHTRVLGAQPPADVDVWLFPPVPGERFLLCSDGLTKELHDSEIAVVLRDEPEPQQAATRLIHAALQAGGQDNITVAVVDHLAVGCSLASP